MDSAQKKLSLSFGSAAATYSKHRPDYAVTAVQWALALAPGGRVLDLGAGTGKLTAGLLALGLDVVAVEPDPAMLSELRRSVPAARAFAGSADAIPLPGGCVDAVLAGNAMHWFDMDTAGPEIARVLSPGGVLAGLWNLMDDRVDWVAGLARVGGPEAVGPRDTPASWRAATAAMHLPTEGGTARFGSSEQAMFPHGQLRTADSLVQTFATKAGILVMSAEARDKRLGEISGYLDWPAGNQSGRVHAAHGHRRASRSTSRTHVAADADAAERRASLADRSTAANLTRPPRVGPSFGHAVPVPLGGRRLPRGRVDPLEPSRNAIP